MQTLRSLINSINSKYSRYPHPILTGRCTPVGENKSIFVADTGQRFIAKGYARGRAIAVRQRVGWVVVNS